MDMLRILVNVAEQLGVEVPAADYAAVGTLGQLVAYIEGRRTGTA